MCNFKKKPMALRIAQMFAKQMHEYGDYLFAKNIS